jgi:hypothetical protein
VYHPYNLYVLATTLDNLQKRQEIYLALRSR